MAPARTPGRGTPLSPRHPQGARSSAPSQGAGLSPRPAMLHQETPGWGRICPGSSLSSQAAAGLILAPKSGFCLGPRGSLASGWSKDRLGKPGSCACFYLQPRALRLHPTLPQRTLPPPLSSRPFLTAATSTAGDGPTPRPSRAPAQLPAWRRLCEPPTLSGERDCFWPGSGNANTSSFPGNLLRFLPSHTGPAERPRPAAVAKL